MSEYILVIDQGTSSTRAIVYDRSFQSVGVAQQEIAVNCPQDGWVEQDPAAILATTTAVCRQAVAQAGAGATIHSVGITNQRETTIVWDRATGTAIGPAIVWQDRRTQAHCQALRARNVEARVTAKTGLLLDPYFSATKIAWILDNTPGARARAERGELAFGTVDSYLLWQLTAGQTHATDATNASRTLLFNIHEQCWDEELLQLLQVPAAVLPEVRDTVADFGKTSAAVCGFSAPITAVIGDQQSALVGQACTQTGMAKCTFGTGCFLVANTGKAAVASQHKLLSTVAYRIGGEVTYGLEGSIFIAGSLIQWLRDNVNFIVSAAQTEAIAAKIPEDNGIYFVPAFAGLGAPYWDADARGAILGLHRGTSIEDIVAAGLHAVGYQTQDLLTTIKKDGIDLSTLRIDGGMAANHWFNQFLANITRVSVQVPADTETTALGAAYLAGLAAGWIESLDSLGEYWRAQQVYTAEMPLEQQQKLYKGWQRAVQSVLTDSAG
ncbi:glycerol kinase GlpK [Exilibacterium tricleocarpae]|uniref:glycerol kinase n=1 Tax=Exilibacterium tricleocarpae TaxID=2591008 RepID=A0A545SS20_9GAMM|nr:glycerol kinase GlpK [Exilibacterium tricleocarpae]TQV67752.1 glycerol kinase GlpK [Exilibacterium tricleocarpae]